MKISKIYKYVSSHLINVTIYLLIIYLLILISGKIDILPFLLKVVRVISPLFFGLVIAWLINPIVSFLERGNVKRSLGTIITYLIFFIVIYFTVEFVVPKIIDQVQLFIGDLPQISDNVGNSIESTLEGFRLNEDILNMINKYVRDLFSNIDDTLVFSFRLIENLIETIAYILFTLTIAFYFTVEYASLKVRFLKLFSVSVRDKVDKLLSNINEDLVHYLKGILIIVVFIFIMTSLLFWAIGLKYQMLFGLVVAITNIIPFIGNIIGGVIVAVFALFQDMKLALLSIIIIVVVQLIEGSILQPYIIGKNTDIHPVLIIVGVLIGGAFFGILGMIFSTPTIIIIINLIEFFTAKSEEATSEII